MQILTTLFVALFLLLTGVKSCLVADFTWDKGPDIWRGSLVDDGIIICTLYSIEAFMYNNLAYLECIEGYYGLLEYVGEEKWKVYYTKPKPKPTLHTFELKEEGNKAWLRMWARNFGC